MSQDGCGTVGYLCSGKTGFERGGMLVILVSGKLAETGRTLPAITLFCLFTSCGEARLRRTAEARRGPVKLVIPDTIFILLPWLQF